MGNWLILTGIFLIIMGIFINASNKLTIFPGDIFIQKENITFYFPIITSIIISIIFTIILNIFK